MHCFYIEPPKDGLARLPAEEAKHALRVLRLGPGDAVCAMDGAGRRWDAEIESVSNGVTVRLLQALPSNEPPVKLTVYQGIPKAEKLELIVQKLTELGASVLAPVRMARCVAKLDDRDGAKRQTRLQRIADEGAKQCQRAAPLRVMPPLDWRGAVEQMRGHDLLIVPWEEASGRRVRDACDRFPEARDIGVVIGPEGGMSAHEVEAMAAAGGVTVTLGPRILRAETAAIAAAALVMTYRGDI